MHRTVLLSFFLLFQTSIPIHADEPKSCNSLLLGFTDEGPSITDDNQRRSLIETCNGEELEACQAAKSYFKSQHPHLVALFRCEGAPWKEKENLDTETLANYCYRLIDDAEEEASGEDMPLDDFQMKTIKNCNAAPTEACEMALAFTKNAKSKFYPHLHCQ